MSAIAKFAWSFRGRDEVKSLVSNRSSFATQHGENSLVDHDASMHPTVLRTICSSRTTQKEVHNPQALRPRLEQRKPQIPEAVKMLISACSPSTI